MSADKEEEDEASVKDNPSSDNDDSSSVFSDLEPPPPQPEAIPNPPEPNDDSPEEEKEEIVENDKEESNMNDDHNIAEMAEEKEKEEDVEEGKIHPEALEIATKQPEETSMQVETEPSPLVHIGSTRGETSSRKSPMNNDGTEPNRRSNRTLMIAGLCLCLFVIVIVQAITLGLVLSQQADSNDKGTTSFEDTNKNQDDPSQIPTVRPTDQPSVTPTQGAYFESIANAPGAVRLNQVSFCDECTEYVRVSSSDYLPWSDWTYVTELEVNSNGFVYVYCWNFGQCGTIDIVALNLSPNVKGSVYILWEQDDEESPLTSVQEAADGADSRQRQPQRASTLTISFEEVMIYGFFDDTAPYQVNAQVKISQDEITFCYGDGNIQFNTMRSGFYNYTADHVQYVPATGLTFNRNGYTSTFPEGTCQSLSSSSHGGVFLPTESPTYYYYSNSPTDWWNGGGGPPTAQPIVRLIGTTTQRRDHPIGTIGTQLRDPLIGRVGTQLRAPRIGATLDCRLLGTM